MPGWAKSHWRRTRGARPGKPLQRRVRVFQAGQTCLERVQVCQAKQNPSREGLGGGRLDKPSGQHIPEFVDAV